MSSYEFVETAREGNILKVTLDRPKVYNAMHPPMHHELDAIWNDFAADQDLWVAVLTGAGDKAFSAGNDLKYTASGGTMQPPASGFAGLGAVLDPTGKNLDQLTLDDDAFVENALTMLNDDDAFGTASKTARRSGRGRSWDTAASEFETLFR